MNVRLAGPADVTMAARLHLATALAAYAEIFPPAAPKPTVEDMAQRWKVIVTEGIGWIAVMGDEPVGVAGLIPEPDGSRLSAVYVTPEHWGEGIGSALVDRAEATAAERGWTPLRLWVLEANTRARSWYETRGWNREGATRRTVWGDIDDVGYVMGEDVGGTWRA